MVSAVKWKLFSSGSTQIADTSWAAALARCRYARALGAADRKRLRDLAGQFGTSKSFDGAAGFTPTEQNCAVIALKACVPILNLGIDYYAGWSDIVVYPGDFRVHQEYVDHAGVVHREPRDLCGQSLSQGPMVLSWDTVEQDRRAPDRDVVMHECAHKLDILNGAANGFPPLHKHMSAKRWSRVFQQAYARFAEAVDEGVETGLDPYAATNPAEFFAVLSETFFTEPTIVQRDFPSVYAELVDFYRQDPLTILIGRA
jgi:MtfA peptidase